MHCDPHLDQTKFNDLLSLTIDGVLDTKMYNSTSNALEDFPKFFRTFGHCMGVFSELIFPAKRSTVA